VKYLTNTNQSEFLYIFKAYSTATPISFLLALIVYSVYPDAEAVTIKMNTLKDFFGIVIIGPFLETLIMVPIIALLKVFLRQQTMWIALWSALIWAGLHSLAVAVWGLVIFFGFFIYTLAFLSWDKISRKKAILITFGIHALNNATAFIISAL